MNGPNNPQAASDAHANLDDQINGPDIPSQSDGSTLYNIEKICRSRSKEDRLVVVQELAIAKDIAQKGIDVLPASPFYQAMFSEHLKNTPGFEI